MQRCLWIAIAVLVLAACGGSAPPPPPAPPKPKPPVQSADDQAEVARAKADNETFRTAQQGIANAADAEAANAARAGYSGQKHKAALDVALERRLREFEFAQMTAAVEALRATTTPFKAEAAAAEYTGDRYRDDLNRALEAHIKALIEKDPSLAGGRTRAPESSPAPPTTGDYERLTAELAKCETESSAATVAEKYKGSLTANEVQVAVEAWRWTNPEVIERHELTGTILADTYRIALLANNLIALETGRGVVVAPRDTLIPLDPPPETSTKELRGGKLAIVLPGGNRFFSIHESRIACWSADSWKLVWQADFVMSFYHDLVLSPDGRMLAAYGDNQLKLHDAETGDVLKVLDKQSYGLQGIGFSPDGAYLMTGGEGVYRKYRVEDGSLVYNHKYRDHQLRHCSWSADGKRVAGYVERKSGPCVVVMDMQTGAVPFSRDTVRLSMQVTMLPSGQHVLAQVGRDELLVLSLKDATGTHPKPLHHQKLSPARERNLALPDSTGQTFVWIAPSETKQAADRISPAYVDILVYGRRP